MWSFLNPMFLWALSAALLPLVLHLMQRRRIVTVRFSTIRFLKLAQKRSSNRIRMENFLLWLLRTLMLLCLALGFAMPILRIASFKQLLGSAQRDVAIVWDVSYSMDYTSGKKKVWDLARDTVVAIIEGLQQGDRVCLFLADDDVTPLIEQPTADLEMVLGQAKAQTPKATSSQLSPATLAACNALKTSGRREHEVFIVTDGQKLPWTQFGQAAATSAAPSEISNPTSASSAAPAASNAPTAAVGAFQWNAAAIDKELMFFAALLGVEAPDNSAPLAVEVQPPLLMADTPAQVGVKLSHSGAPQSLSVTLTVDNEESSRRSLMVQEGISEDLVFPLPALTPGRHTAKIETPADGIALDNAFYFLLQVHEKLPVLVVGAEADAFFLMRALNPGGDLSSIDVRRADTDAFNGGDPSPAGFSCVILCNAVPLTGQAIVALEHYVRRGGLLVLFPGDRGSIADYQSWNILPAMPKTLADLPDDRQRRMLRLVKPGDPLFTGMKLPPGTFPTIALNRELQFEKPDAQAEVIVVSGADAPFLLRRQVEKGRVLMFAASCDRRWSNLPLSPFFLPIVHQIVQFGAGLEQERPYIWTGRNLVLNDLLPNLQEAAELFGPADEALAPQKIKTGNEVTLTLDVLDKPGIYRLRQPDTPVLTPALAANVPRVESDLTRIAAAEIPAQLGLAKDKLIVAESKEDLLRLVKDHRIGRPLGEQLLWLAFALGIVEFFLAGRMSRSSSTLSEQLTIESSGRVKGKAE